MANKTSATQSTADQVVNGVNVTQLTQTIQAIRAQPTLADFKFRVNNTWVDGGYNRAQVGDFYGTGQEISHAKSFAFEADEPPVLLGTDKGANPVELLLTALSACMTTTLAYHAAARGIQLEAVESEYEGDIDLHGFLDLNPNVRKGYKEIRVTFKVKSDADEATLTELVKKSPVFDVVTRPTPVHITIVKA